MSEETIDVRELFRKKNKSFARMVPGFVYRWIERIIHQNEINYILTTYKEYEGSAFIDKLLAHMGVNYEIEGKEHLPPGGRYIFIANHPLGGLDGIVLLTALSKYFDKVKFIVNDLLMNLPNLAPVFIPVNKLGKQSSDYVRMIEDAYASDIQILYFPAGLCSRKIKGNIVDLEWKKNFLQKAIKHNRDIVPIYVDGRNSNRFYNLANIRKALGIKVNIEMFLLPDEMFSQHKKTITLKIGKPIPISTFDKSTPLPQWAERLREHIYLLNKNINTPFNT